MAELAEQSAQAKRVFFKKLIILNKKKIDSLCLFVRLFVAASRAICRGCCWKPCWLPKRPALRGLRGRIASAAPSIRCATRWSTARARPGAAHRAARPEQAAVCAGADGLSRENGAQTKLPQWAEAMPAPEAGAEVASLV